MAADKLPPYRERLDAAMKRAGMGKRTLAKQVAERTGKKPEDVRGAVYDYLEGAEPRVDRAKVIAEILDAPELAVVTAPSARRRIRQEGLEAEVAKLRTDFEAFVQAATARLAGLEAAQVPKGRRSTPRKKA